MNERSPATSTPRRTLVIAALGAACIAGLCTSLPARAGDAASERADLAVILRELDLIDRLSHAAQAEAPEHSRYHFDYRRFRADVARVRSGIENYLTPPRAQPRDPMALSGEYRDGKPSP